MAKATKKAPYVEDPGRLGDVIAAIQAMATYYRYKLTFAEWADRISGDPADGQHWEKVFREHPEFFRLDSARERASLVWRRQHARRYDGKQRRELTNDEYYALSAESRKEISRIPLSASDIKTLVDTAINLHTRAIAHSSDRRWWVPLVGSSAAGAMIGGILGALLKN
jgi:hypothetical protein